MRMYLYIELGAVENRSLFRIRLTACEAGIRELRGHLSLCKALTRRLTL